MNIYDIAQLAGVSIATVSRVVNGSPKVSEKTKARVKAVMEEYDYTPNVFARGLGMNSMQTVGIVCPDVSDAYMASAVSHLEKRLHCYGYDCILNCSGYEKGNKESAVKLLLNKKVDALILVSSHYIGTGSKEDTAYLEEVSKQVPVFLINAYARGDGIYCVLADDYQGMYDAVSELAEKGRKRILFLYDANSYSAAEKMRGYEDALRDNGLQVEEELKIFVENKVHKVRDFLMAQENLEFDAAVAVEDGLAVGVVKYVRQKGFSVPDDVSIVGYNNSELAICCEPELSSVDNREEALCQSAVDTMMTLLKGRHVKHRILLPCILIRRETTNL